MSRSPRDAYWTPPELTRALIDEVPEIGGVIWEPCAGAGWMIDVLAERSTSVIGSDIEPQREDIQRRDALRGEPPADTGWIVTNPPFNIAAQLLRRFLALTPRVALLVRMTFLEGTRDRITTFRAHPPSRTIVLPRREFPRGDGRPQQGVDSVPPVWLVWGVVPQPPTWPGVSGQETLL